jgi:hypothetical protein
MRVDAVVLHSDAYCCLTAGSMCASVVFLRCLLRGHAWFRYMRAFMVEMGCCSALCSQRGRGVVSQLAVVA